MAQLVGRLVLLRDDVVLALAFAGQLGHGERPYLVDLHRGPVKVLPHGGVVRVFVGLLVARIDSEGGGG